MTFSGGESGGGSGDSVLLVRSGNKDRPRRWNLREWPWKICTGRCKAPRGNSDHRLGQHLYWVLVVVAQDMLVEMATFQPSSTQQFSQPQQQQQSRDGQLRRSLHGTNWRKMQEERLYNWLCTTFLERPQWVCILQAHSTHLVWSESRPSLRWSLAQNSQMLTGRYFGQSVSSPVEDLVA